MITTFNPSEYPLTRLDILKNHQSLLNLKNGMFGSLISRDHSLLYADDFSTDRIKPGDVVRASIKCFRKLNYSEWVILGNAAADYNENSGEYYTKIGFGIWDGEKAIVTTRRFDEIYTITNIDDLVPVTIKFVIKAIFND